MKKDNYNEVIMEKDNYNEGIMELLISLNAEKKELKNENEELKRQIKLLNNKIERLMNQNNLQEYENTEIASRVVARNIVIEKIKDELHLKAEIANREDGSGIIIENNGERKKIKFYFSRINREKNNMTWNSIAHDDFFDYSYFIFSISLGSELCNLVFTQEKLKEIISDELENKDVAKEVRYHINFSIEESIEGLRVYKISKDGDIEVTNNIDKFDYFK